LRSLARQHWEHTVYVVDNASTDDTVQAVSTEFPAARLLVNTTNLGFAGGNNVGLAAAFADGADAALVLNNDTTLEPDALDALVTAARNDPTAGILNPVILFATPPHRVWFAGATVDRQTGQSHHMGYNQPREAIACAVAPIPRATGCAMLITRACFERIGLFEESLFMYWEDVEYSLRAQREGFSVLLVPAAIVYHHIATSTGGAKSRDAIYYTVRNGLVTMDRMCPLPPLAMMRRRLWMILGTVYLIAKRPAAPKRLRDMLQGYWDARRHHLGPRDATFTAPNN
jgi:GT2 family glycosyltransferase